MTLRTELSGWYTEAAIDRLAWRPILWSGFMSAEQQLEEECKLRALIAEAKGIFNNSSMNAVFVTIRNGQIVATDRIIRRS